MLVVTEDGRRLGEIVAMQDYGAGDLIEIAVEGTRRTVLLPFTDDVVIEIGDEAVVVDASEGSVAAQFLAPVGDTPQDIEAANDNPEDER